MTTPDFDLQGYARSLPQPFPSDALLDRIVHAHARRRARRGAVAGVLGVLALVALAGAWMPRSDAPPSAGAGQIASARQATELRATDRALQAAYERGANDAELAPLWSRRLALQGGRDAPLPLEL
jgi:hypothetical protein